MDSVRIEISDVNSYIDSNIKTKDIHELSKLNIFFNNPKYNVDMDDYIELIKSNTIVNSIISKYVDENKEVIEKQLYDENIDNDVIINFIELYCEINNIDQQEVVDSEELNDQQESNKQNSRYEKVRDKIYYDKIRKMPQLTKEEEQELAKQIALGNEKAREKMITHNLRLVMKIAHKYVGSGLEFEDLVEEGNTGLIRAVDRYDVTKGYKFSTYATWWIKQSILRAIQNTGRNIRIPNYMHNKIFDLKKVQYELEEELKREPNLKELADRLNMSITDVGEIYNLQYDTRSLNEKLKDDSDDELGDFVIDKESSSIEDEIISKTKKQDVIKLLYNCGLTKKEIKVLVLLYGIVDDKKRTLEEVGKMFGLTRERIRQIESRALRKIRLSKNIIGYEIYMQDVEGALENIQNYKEDIKDRKYNYSARNKYDFEEARKRNKKEEIYIEKKPQTIYELLNEYDKELIDKMIEILPSEDRKLIHIRYGEDLENPVISPLWNKEISEKFYGHLLKKMKVKLEELRVKKQKGSIENLNNIKSNNSKTKNNSTDDTTLTEEDNKRKECIKVLKGLHIPNVDGIANSMPIDDLIEITNNVVKSCKDDDANRKIKNFKKIK